MFGGAATNNGSRRNSAQKFIDLRSKIGRKVLDLGEAMELVGAELLLSLDVVRNDFVMISLGLSELKKNYYLS